MLKKKKEFTPEWNIGTIDAKINWPPELSDLQYLLSNSVKSYIIIKLQGSFIESSTSGTTSLSTTSGCSIQHHVGISMSMNCAPLLLNLSMHSSDAEFI